jgi:type III secretory pathway component EscS
MTDKPTGGGGFVISTLLLCLPSLFAVFSSMQVASSGGVGTSALWFIFQVSEYVGVVTILVGTVLTLIKATDGTISKFYVSLMGLSVVLSVFLLWYAFHIYRSPWF